MDILIFKNISLKSLVLNVFVSGSMSSKPKHLTIILREVNYEDDRKNMVELCTNRY